MESLGKFNSKEIEERILAWWTEEQIYQQIKAKEPQDEKKLFFFPDGPPYTTGNVHLGTAWNKILKDYLIHYKRMQGYRVTDTPGYDTHGLPIEVVIEKQLGIHNKKEIEAYGLDKFIKKCRDHALSLIPTMNEQFKRLGCVFWDWENPYITLKNTYVQGAWWTMKKAWENGYLYKFFKPQNCCPRCATALAKHEYEYHTIKDNAIFVKFQSVDDPKTFFIIWTTTPWTLVSNTNIMVNPDMEYVKMRVKDEHWIMGIASTSDLLQNKLDLALNAPDGFSYGERYTGYDLEGKRYIHPFAEEIPRQGELEQEEPRVHTILLSREYVMEGGGSGLVHSAPGHGPEDFEVGIANGIPPFSPVNVHGEYSSEAGPEFEGKFVHGVNEEIIERLKKKNTLVHLDRIEHEYAHCWRCNSKLVYRATEQWFFKTSTLRNQMLKENEEIKWVPNFAGANNFKSWLSNLNDWCISRQRFWGIPLPIWECDNEECDNMFVIGSKEELREKAGDCPDDIHKPWIDKVTWKCPKCSGTMRRIPDVLDVWLDSGSLMWAGQQFFDGHEHYDTWKTADFILEGKDQIRGWFNSLLCSAMVSSKKRNYNACYMHGWVLANGVKMSKSIGNSVEPKDVIAGKIEILNKQQKLKLAQLAAAINTSKFDKTKENQSTRLQEEMQKRKKKYLMDNPKWSNVNGIETFRFFSVKATPPGKDFNFDYKEYTDTFRTLNTFWNSYLFAQEKMKLNNFDPLQHKLKYETLPATDKWILARTNVLIENITALFEDFQLPSIPTVLEEFILYDLSRWYIPSIRDVVDLNNKDPAKYNTFAVLWHVLYNLCLIMAPVNPMLTEELYQKMFAPMMGKSALKSVHLESWPKSVSAFDNPELVEQMDITRKIIDQVRSTKNDHKIKLRWPTKGLYIFKKDENAPDLMFVDLIQEMSNVRKIEVVSEEISRENIVNTSYDGYLLQLDLEDSKELQQERVLADLLRGLQYLRKQSKLKMGDKISLQLSTNQPFLSTLLEERKDDIAMHVFAEPLEVLATPLEDEEGWTSDKFYACVNDNCYAMIRAKQAQSIQAGKAYSCRYCEKEVTVDTLGTIDIKFQKLL